MNTPHFCQSISASLSKSGDVKAYHFQTFVDHPPGIVVSLGKSSDVEAYRSARRMWFNAFKARYEGHLDAELTGILDVNRAEDMRLHEPTPLDSTVLQADLTEAFAA